MLTSTGKSAAETVAPVSPERQEEKEVLQGQIYSDTGEARLEDQKQDARAECAAARPGVSEWERKT